MIGCELSLTHTCCPCFAPSLVMVSLVVRSCFYDNFCGTGIKFESSVCFTLVVFSVDMYCIDFC